MFKKLRIKFIAITMAMVALVMALAFSVVCAIEYQRSSSVVETALSDAVEQAKSDPMQGGRLGFHAFESDGERPFAREGEAPYGQLEDMNPDDLDEDDGILGEGFDELADAAVEGEIAPPFIGNRDGQARTSSSLIPVAVYRALSTGDMQLVPGVTSASIDSDVLSEAAEQALQAPDGFGTFSDIGLYYYKATVDGNTILAFTDSSYADGWKSLALMLVLVGLATLVVFFIITLFYSRWALKPVREAWDSQRQFVADASHDLKTPLTVILANSAILLKHPDHSIASESQWIESTQTEAVNMQGLVNEMLELAQIEAGEQVNVQKEPLDFSDLVDGETLLFDSVALERNCSFACEIQPEIRVLGDEKQVKKMVSTLVENAFKYVDDGGTISVDLRKEGRSVVLAVRNTGSVISAEDLPHIFDRFYRTDKARTSGAGGFGLGLSIAREIARQHDGDITCASSAHAGTTFTVTLPLLKS